MTNQEQAKSNIRFKVKKMDDHIRIKVLIGGQLTDIVKVYPATPLEEVASAITLRLKEGHGFSLPLDYKGLCSQIASVASSPNAFTMLYMTLDSQVSDEVCAAAYFNGERVGDLLPTRLNLRIVNQCRSAAFHRFQVKLDLPIGVTPTAELLLKSLRQAILIAKQHTVVSARSFLQTADEVITINENGLQDVAQETKQPSRLPIIANTLNITYAVLQRDDYTQLNIHLDNGKTTILKFYPGDITQAEYLELLSSSVTDDDFPKTISDGILSSLRVRFAVLDRIIKHFKTTKPAARLYFTEEKPNLGAEGIDAVCVQYGVTIGRVLNNRIDIRYFDRPNTVPATSFSNTSFSIQIARGARSTSELLAILRHAMEKRDSCAFGLEQEMKEFIQGKPKHSENGTVRSDAAGVPRSAEALCKLFNVEVVENPVPFIDGLVKGRPGLPFRWLIKENDTHVLRKAGGDRQSAYEYAAETLQLHQRLNKSLGGNVAAMRKGLENYRQKAHCRQWVNSFSDQALCELFEIKVLCEMAPLISSEDSMSVWAIVENGERRFGHHGKTRESAFAAAVAVFNLRERLAQYAGDLKNVTRRAMDTPLQ